MRGRSISTFQIVILLTMISIATLPAASAHVPTFSDEHTGLDSAVTVEEPTKSWVLYGELHHEEDVSYYKLDLDRGDRLRLVLFSTEQDYILSVVIMGPGITSGGQVPEFIETPNGSGAMVVPGERPDSAEFEPFTPGSYFYFVDYDQEINVSGTYYAAVYSTEGEGSFGMAVGYRETFSAQEWVRVPLDAIRIHMWEGQNIVVILLPLILTVIAGLVILIRLKPRGISLPMDEQWRVIGAVAGLIYLGTGFMMLYQLARAATIGPAGAAAVVTLIFIAIPMVLGYIILGISLQPGETLTRRKRLRLILLAVLGLIMWGGLIIGPVLAVIAAFSPAKRANITNIANTTNSAKQNPDESSTGSMP